LQVTSKSANLICQLVSFSPQWWMYPRAHWSLDWWPVLTPWQTPAKSVSFLWCVVFMTQIRINQWTLCCPLPLHTCKEQSFWFIPLPHSSAVLSSILRLKK
jgi:hypothetical protein